MDLTLEPDQHLHRAVFATPCPVFGSYQSGDLRLDPAWPLNHDGRMGALERVGTFVVSFKADGRETLGDLMILQEFNGFASLICDLFSLRFGKRIEFLGFFQSNGLFRQPRDAHARTLATCLQQHPFVSDKPRVDYPPTTHDDTQALNLDSADLVTWALDSEGRELAPFQAVLNATHFYAEALRTFDQHPDYAFLSLVTAGEILAGAFEYDIYDILDPKAQSFIDRVRCKLRAKDERYALEHMFAATAKFVQALSESLDDGFFERTEIRDPRLATHSLQKDTIKSTLRAAYSIRSHLSHAGKRPTPWIRPDLPTEMPAGTPVISDDDRWSTALAACPTHLGLERIIRYALLNKLLALNPADTDGPVVGEQPTPPRRAVDEEIDFNRAGAITPQSEDEADARKRLELPEMSLKTVVAREEEGGVRRPITLAAPSENPGDQPTDAAEEFGAGVNPDPADDPSSEEEAEGDES